MLEIRRTAGHALETLTAPAEGCWLHAVRPTATDLAAIESCGVRRTLLTHLDDHDERPRVEHDGDAVLVVLHYPLPRPEPDGPPWRMLPLTVVLTPRGVVTLAPEAAPFLQPLLDGTVARLDTRRGADFVLRVFWHLADACLQALRGIERSVDRLECELKRSLRNEEVLGLLDYQKSLTYFATGLKANELVLERLRHMSAVGWLEQDHELLEDVRIELRQAIDMVEIADNILSQMMDAFASIVSNNLNAVMKVLTSMTIILAVPTLIASLYGMNVALPGAHGRLAFAGIVLASVAAGVVLAVVFRRRNWL
jgi:magnesium transporter